MPIRSLVAIRAVGGRGRCSFGGTNVDGWEKDRGQESRDWNLLDACSKSRQLQKDYWKREKVQGYGKGGRSGYKVVKFRGNRRERFERRTRFNPRERRSVERCWCDERWQRMGKSCHPKSGIGEPREEIVGTLKSMNVGAAGTWIRFGAAGLPLASTNELWLWRSYQEAWIIQKQIPFRVSAITKNAPVERCSEQDASRV